MAEYVRWRLTKLRAGVTMALFGLLAGLGLRTDQGPAAQIEQAATLTIPKGTHIPANSIGSAQIKFHSLLLSDYKPRQVASYTSMVKMKKALGALDEQFIKMNDTLAKVNDELGTFELRTDAANTFLAKDATAANAAKIEGVGLDGLIQGRGQVFTGGLVPSQTAAPVVSVPGVLTVNGHHDPAANPDISLTNTSGGDLEINDGTNPTTTLKAGDTLPAGQMGDGSVRTFQVLVSGGGEAITLTISGFADGSAHRLVGQALIGVI
jgi:hypothetical protein